MFIQSSWGAIFLHHSSFFSREKFFYQLYCWASRNILKLIHLILFSLEYQYLISMWKVLFFGVRLFIPNSFNLLSLILKYKINIKRNFYLNIVILYTIKLNDIKISTLFRKRIDFLNNCVFKFRSQCYYIENFFKKALLTGFDSRKY